MHEEPYKITCKLVNQCKAVVDPSMLETQLPEHMLPDQFINDALGAA